MRCSPSGRRTTPRWSEGGGSFVSLVETLRPALDGRAFAMLRMISTSDTKEPPPSLHLGVLRCHSGSTAIARLMRTPGLRVVNGRGIPRMPCIPARRAHIDWGMVGVQRIMDPIATTPSARTGSAFSSPPAIPSRCKRGEPEMEGQLMEQEAHSRRAPCSDSWDQPESLRLPVPRERSAFDAGSTGSRLAAHECMESVEP